MTELRLHSNDGGGGDEIARALRELYAAPAGEAYWNELEAKIMSRLTEIHLGWWGELDRWARPALVAAALLLLAAGIAMFRARQTETQIAYENILTPSPAPVGAAIRPMLQSERDETLRYVLGH